MKNNARKTRYTRWDVGLIRAKIDAFVLSE